MQTSVNANTLPTTFPVGSIKQFTIRYLDPRVKSCCIFCRIFLNIFLRFKGFLCTLFLFLKKSAGNTMQPTSQLGPNTARVTPVVTPASSSAQDICILPPARCSRTRLSEACASLDIPF